MKNLNKFTKQDLINKIKNLDKQNNTNTNSSFLHKIVEYIIYFKSLILKLTLLGFIIKWFRKYSLMQKFWHFFSLISSGLLGISLIDIYSLDLILWIKDTSIYKWYSELFYPKEVNKETNEFQFPKRIATETNESETRNNSISDWINRNPKKEIEEINEGIWNNYKHIIIISGIVIGTVVTWYYSAEIKDGFSSIIDWIKSFSSEPSDDPSGSSNDSNQTSSREDIQSRLTKFFRNEALTNNSNPIELIDKGKGIDNPPSFSEATSSKSLLTSPSLESLNNKAEEAWSDTSSPKSDDSSATITQSKFTESVSISKISDSIKNVESLELLESKVSESSASSSSNPLNIENLVQKYWKFTLFNLEENKKIKFIENIFKNSDNPQLDLNTAEELCKILVNIIEIYNDKTAKYYYLVESDKEKYKESLYYFRKWIYKYHKLIINEDLVVVGNITDSPKELVIKKI